VRAEYVTAFSWVIGLSEHYGWYKQEKATAQAKYWAHQVGNTTNDNTNNNNNDK
jgi:hypothetical protein